MASSKFLGRMIQLDPTDPTVPDENYDLVKIHEGDKVFCILAVRKDVQFCAVHTAITKIVNRSRKVHLSRVHLMLDGKAVLLCIPVDSLLLKKHDNVVQLHVDEIVPDFICIHCGTPCLFFDCSDYSVNLDHALCGKDRNEHSCCSDPPRR